MTTKLTSQYTSAESTYLIGGPSTSLEGKHFIIIIFFHFKIFEVNSIPSNTFVIKAWAHIALHLMKQVQIIHELMKGIASTTLQKKKASRHNHQEIVNYLLRSAAYQLDSKLILTTILFIFSKLLNYFYKIISQKYALGTFKLTLTSQLPPCTFYIINQWFLFLVLIDIILATQNKNFTLRLRSMIKSLSYYLHKDSPISECMGIDCPSCSLPTYVTSESYEHSTARRLCKERPGKSGDILSAWLWVDPSRSRRPFHPRTCSPPSSCCSAHHQPHCRVLIIFLQQVKCHSTHTKKLHNNISLLPGANININKFVTKASLLLSLSRLQRNDMQMDKCNRNLSCT